MRFGPDIDLCPDTGHLISVRADPVELVQFDTTLWNKLLADQAE